MAVVLVVGDDGLLAVLLRREAAARKTAMDILALRPGEKGVAALAVGSADLLLLDLANGDPEDADTIEAMRHAVPDVPLIVRSTHPHDLSGVPGARWVVKSPDMAALFADLSAALGKELRTTVSGIHIGHFLQLVAADKKTVAVRVHGGGSKGLLFFEQGELCHAILGTKSGRKAALEILAMADEPDMEVRKFYSRCDRTIREPVDALVVAADRLRAERGGSAKAPGPAGTDASPGKGADTHKAGVLQAVATLPGIAMAALAKRDGRLVEAYGGGQRLATLLAYLGMESDRVRALLGYRSARHIVLSCSSGDKVVVLFGEEVCAGFMLDASAHASPVVSRALTALRDAGLLKEGGAA